MKTPINTWILNFIKDLYTNREAAVRAEATVSNVDRTEMPPVNIKPGDRVKPGDWVSVSGVIHVVKSVISEDSGNGPVALRCRITKDSGIEIDAGRIEEVRRA